MILFIFIQQILFHKNLIAETHNNILIFRNIFTESKFDTEIDRKFNLIDETYLDNEIYATIGNI